MMPLLGDVRVEYGQQKHSPTGKMLVRMENHANSDSELAAIQTARAYEESQQTTSVTGQIRNVAEQE